MSEFALSIYNTIQYNTIQYNTIQYNTIQYNTIRLFSVKHTNCLNKTVMRTYKHTNWVRYRLVFQEIHVYRGRKPKHAFRESEESGFLNPESPGE